MKIKFAIFFFLCVSFSYAQNLTPKVIPLYSGKVPGSEKWNWQEAEMYSDAWQTEVVYNVVAPSLTAYLPAPRNANGTAVVICPGGAFHALSINSEGVDVAKWLVSKGVSAFVLKYRLVKSETDDPVTEVMAKMGQEKFNQDSERIIPLAIADGLEAIKYLREHADKLNIDPGRIGIIGFSAGGTVATGAALQGKDSSRPDFVAPIYPYIPPSMRSAEVTDNAPPLFVLAASDDQLGLAPHSISLYTKWIEAQRPAELHLYARGGHGFGMRRQDLPSDTWIDRFGDWIAEQGLLLSPKSAITPQEDMRRKKDAEARFHNDWANLDRYREENQKLDEPKRGEQRVVFMGNSITAGWINLRPEFFKGKPYINRGIGGQTTPQMLIRFNQDVIDLKPGVVVLLAGINDIAQNTGPTTLEAIMDNISGMALLAKSQGIKVILCSVLPAYDFPWRPGLEPAGKVIALNRMIKDFAEKNDIYYLDYFSAMVDSRNGLPEKYSRDEVHPTVEGYRVMEPMVEKAIADVLKGK